MELSNFSNYHKNPRFITDKELDDLGKSLEDLGDLSGFVVNLRTNEIISGNQRSIKIFKDPSAKLVDYVEYDTPSQAGTVAFGYIEYKEEKFPIRFVDWDEETAEIANLRANKYGGHFDFDALVNQFDVDSLLAGGFSMEELTGMDKEELDDMEEQIEDELSSDTATLVLTFPSQEDIDSIKDDLISMIQDNFNISVSAR